MELTGEKEDEDEEEERRKRRIYFNAIMSAPVRRIDHNLVPDDSLVAPVVTLSFSLCNFVSILSPFMFSHFLFSRIIVRL